MLDRLREIVGQRCQDWDGELVGFSGETDHVHILASLPPNLDLSRFVNNVKTTSSRLIRRDFGRELPVAGLLVSLLPHHHVRRCPAAGAQAVRG
jgi:REP element-mobilizing transposase RayT